MYSIYSYLNFSILEANLHIQLEVLSVPSFWMSGFLDHLVEIMAVFRNSQKLGNRIYDNGVVSTHFL